jgi:hypothetical protein
MISLTPGQRANYNRADTCERNIRSIREVTLGLLAYCRASDWAGYDPYDGLNSRLFKAMPLSSVRIFRLMLTQAMKTSPVNLRPLLGVGKTQNAKGLALFLTAILKLHKLGLLKDNNLSQALVAQIIALRSPDTEYWSWGYSFPWQTRTMLVPRGTPNLVCTIFVANALLDAFEALGDARCLEMALSAGDYLVKKLYYTEGVEIASFSYPLPTSKAKVHNANFLAAAFLSRLYQHTGNERLVDPALQAARYSASRQRADGSWQYGELANQGWIDNFHTGYNLTSLRAIARHLGTSEFESHIRVGFEFYRSHFFREDGAVRYFHDRTYPIDIHCVAQSLLTLIEFQSLAPSNLSLIRLVYTWAMKHMWDNAGFFYYRTSRTLTIRTSYMRWSQAWMLLALATLAEDETKRSIQALQKRSPAMTSRK